MIRILQPCKLLKVQRKFGDELHGEEEAMFINTVSEQVRESLVNSRYIKIIDNYVPHNGEDTGLLQILQNRISHLEKRVLKLEGEERSKETLPLPDLPKKGGPVFFIHNGKTIEGVTLSVSRTMKIVKAAVAGEPFEVKFSDLVDNNV